MDQIFRIVFEINALHSFKNLSLDVLLAWIGISLNEIMSFIFHSKFVIFVG